MSKKTLSKEKSIRRTKTLTELVVCAVIITSGVYVFKTGFDNMTTVQQSKFVNAADRESIELPDTNEEIDPDKIIFTYAPVESKSKFFGNLILVNNEYVCFTPEDDRLVSISEKNEETERDFFTAVDNTYTIIDEVYEPMATMIQDFYDIYENDTLIIYGSYRTKDFQKQLYDNRTEDDDEEYPLVAMPGHSEHETGYAFDFSETVEYDYQGTGDFEWINKNCYKYGFVVRYNEDKEAITEYRSEPWHFRYVGIPHATYMTKNNLCLEEYTDLLRYNHAYDMEHLEITDDDGAEYEVFFFASDDGAEFTDVPVPTGYRYDISGNNIDGFVVTVHKSEKVEPGQENAAMNEMNEEPTEEPEESEESEEITEDEETAFE